MYNLNSIIWQNGGYQKSLTPGLKVFSCSEVRFFSKLYLTELFVLYFFCEKNFTVFRTDLNHHRQYFT